MKTQAAVLFDNNQQLVAREIEVDEPQADEILVKISATGICHTDMVARMVQGLVPMPAVLGHEGSGIVAKIGSAVKNIQVGDHVVMSFAACHHCDNCLEGHVSTCEHFNDLNFSGRTADNTSPYHIDDQDLSIFFGQSSFSHYSVVKANNAVVVDPEVDINLLGPLGCGIQTGAGTVINSLRPRAGENIAIFGGGAVGLSAVMAANLIGCEKILVVDIHENRLVLAQELGATHVINSKTEDAVAIIRQLTGKGCHYAIDTTGNAQCVLQAVHATRSLGKIATIGFTGEVTFNIQNDIMGEGKSLLGVVEGDAIPQIFIPHLVNLYKKGVFPFDRLIEFYSFDQIEQAFADSASGKTIKPVVKM